MKQQLCSFVLTGLLATGVAAQQESGSEGQSIPLQSTSRVGGLSAGPISKKSEKRLAHLTRRYKLTSEQQSQVRSILSKEEQDRQTVSADRFMSGGNKREEAVSLHDASQQQIGAILDEKQKRKFDGDEKRRAWMDGRLPEPNPGPL